MLRLAILPALLLLSFAARAGEFYYEMSAPAVAAYERILRLELQGAQADIDRLRARQPANLVTHHLESYLDFFRLYLSGSERLRPELEARFDRRIAALEEGDESSPWYRYALAEARLHQSLIHLRFERQLAAFRELNRAHKLLRDNAEEFPDFALTYKDLGLVHAAVGSIPSQYKWGVEVISSLTGTIAEGRAELLRARNAGASPFGLETEVLSSFLELHLAGNPEAAYRRINDLGLDPAANALHAFVLANMAMRSGRNDRALSVLDKQPRGGAVADFPYLDFMLGLAKLRRLDPTARIHFQSFLVRYAGRHFKEEARQKIAWSYLLEGDEAGYLSTLDAIGGDSKAGGDQNAAREAARARLPHPALLRARLLFDGNYCEKARKELNGVDVNSLSADERLEYYYRTGRVLEGLTDYPGALSFYQQTIDRGADNPAFYACKAALQAGLVEEQRGNKAAAQAYFERCLDLDPAEYRHGLHLLAKAGLNRVR